MSNFLLNDKGNNLCKGSIVCLLREFSRAYYGDSPTVDVEMDSFFRDDLQSWTYIDRQTNEHVAVLMFVWDNPYSVFVHGYARHPDPQYKGLGKQLLSLFIQKYAADINIWMYCKETKGIEEHCECFGMIVAASPNVNDVSPSIRAKFVPYSYQRALETFCYKLGLETEMYKFLFDRQVVILCSEETCLYTLIGIPSDSPTRQNHMIHASTSANVKPPGYKRRDLYGDVPSMFNEPFDLERDLEHFVGGVLDVEGATRGEDGWYTFNED